MSHMPTVSGRPRTNPAKVTKVELEPKTTGLRVRRADHSTTTDRLLYDYIKKPSNFSLALMSEKHNI